ncbi:hypothetical protein CC2G_007517 [Coprinopsis cinerea AmutBmut pab1-1]|nr:hypothetical protein CC2G_007517 [Coprinopsis cinerea AmutBmut pab1-1]
MAAPISPAQTYDSPLFSAPLVHVVAENVLGTRCFSSEDPFAWENIPQVRNNQSSTQDPQRIDDISL